MNDCHWVVFIQHYYVPLTLDGGPKQSLFDIWHGNFQPSIFGTSMNLVTYRLWFQRWHPLEFSTEESTLPLSLSIMKTLHWVTILNMAWKQHIQVALHQHKSKV